MKKIARRLIQALVAGVAALSLAGTATAQTGPKVSFNDAYVLAPANSTVNLPVYVSNGVQTTSGVSVTVRIPEPQRFMVAPPYSVTSSLPSQFVIQSNLGIQNSDGTLDFRFVIYPTTSPVPTFDSRTSIQIATLSFNVSSAAPSNQAIYPQVLGGGLGFEVRNGAKIGMTSIADATGNSVVADSDGSGGTDATLDRPFGGQAIVRIAPPTQTTVVANASDDVWHHFAAVNPATSPTGRPWLKPSSASQGDRRDSVTVLKFRPQLPPGFNTTSFRVSLAKLTVYEVSSATWQPTGVTNSYGQPSRLEVYPGRFGPTYNETSWNGTQPFVGGNGTATLPRDPAPIDKVTQASVQNSTNGSPYALATISGYTPGAMSAPFPIEFYFDVNDPTVQSQLQQDLRDGQGTWVISSTYEGSISSAAGSIPTLILTEGVAANPGSLAPVFVAVVDSLPPAAASSWSMYE